MWWPWDVVIYFQHIRSFFAMLYTNYKVMHSMNSLKTTMDNSKVQFRNPASSTHCLHLLAQNLWTFYQNFKIALSMLILSSRNPVFLFLKSWKQVYANDSSGRFMIYYFNLNKLPQVCDKIGFTKCLFKWENLKECVIWIGYWW